jgi:xylulokinase
MSYLMGIDIGTTGAKALIIDEKGTVAASSNFEYPLQSPAPGWAEQDPAQWWEAVKSGIPAALTAAALRADQIAALGLSGQMHGSVFLDQADQVIRPCILWCDQRTGEQCDWITDTVGKDLLTRETCNACLTGFTAGKIIWLRQKEPANYARVRKILLPKDYIRLRLTGEYATEVSDASGTCLLNVPQRRWSDKVLAALQLDQSLLPPVFESPVVSGRISASAAEVTGLKAGTPVVGGGGDQAAGGVGTGIVKTGLVSSSTGTSGVVFAFLDKPTFDPQLRTHTFCHAVPGKWQVMGAALSAGGSLRWFRDAFAAPEKDIAAQMRIDPYDLLAQEAAQAQPGCEGLMFLPYLTGERTPHADPSARGVFFGISLRHQKRHFIRAVMEGAAFGMKDSFDILQEMAVPIEQVRATGGGARSALWRQIQADVTGLPHHTINVEEGPAYGVALLAAVGAGVFSSVEEACEATISLRSRTDPIPDNVALYRECHRIFRQLYRNLKATFAETAQLVARRP